MQEINPNQQKYMRGKGAPCAGGWVVRGSGLINLKKSTAEGFGSCRHCEGVPTYCRAARGGRRREGGAAPGSEARLGGGLAPRRPPATLTRRRAAARGAGVGRVVRRWDRGRVWGREDQHHADLVPALARRRAAARGGGRREGAAAPRLGTRLGDEGAPTTGWCVAKTEIRARRRDRGRF